MIKGTLIREWKGERRTIGLFRLRDHDGKVAWQCCVCEDPVRGGGDPATVAEWKIKGDSAIPYGTYKVRKTYSQRFKRNMWELQDVPGFAGVRIHAGNTERDTEGCLLFGKHVSGDYDGVAKSRECVAEFEQLMESIGNPEWELEVK